MDFQIGDTVIHRVHGFGKIVSIEEMMNAGIIQPCYVVEIELMKLWVPVEKASEGSLRFPAKRNQFRALFNILRAPGESLPDQQYQRQMELRQRTQNRTLEGLCHVIRDLTDRSRHHTLNQNDSQVLYRAKESLLDEWVISQGTLRSDASRELDELLGGDQPKPKDK
jgi:RNA polymerase-interacting CarD/CdnL/TRCF family regulator